jgi:hypothetical protein
LTKSTVLETVGAALVVAGLAMWLIPVALIAAGVFLMVKAFELEVRR